MNDTEEQILDNIPIDRLIEHIDKSSGFEEWRRRSAEIVAEQIGCDTDEVLRIWDAHGL